MPKIQEYTPNTTQFFLLDGLIRERGSWGLFYESDDESGLGQEKVGILYKTSSDYPPLVPAKKFSDYTDASDTPYSSMTALVTDLNTFLGL
jgi:hypothetical protein